MENQQHFDDGERVRVCALSRDFHGMEGTVTEKVPYGAALRHHPFYYMVKLDDGRESSFWPKHLEKIGRQLEFSFMEDGDDKAKERQRKTAV